MKRILSIAILVLFVTTMYSATKVEVYYFHYTRRCVTCQSVENQSQKIVQELYAKQVKEGTVKFIGVNLDEKGSEAIAKKVKAEGQALLVIGNGKRIDLTDKGFMYAYSQPEKLKEELKKAIDPLL